MGTADVRGLVAMFWPAKRRVNFTNPVNGRLWLRLLQADPRHGLRFRPEIAVGKRVLGFSFRSNRFGLRGPASPEAPNVLLGTSFAMGLSVDEGENWYDRLLDPARWFNAAMPVGPHNQSALLEDLYRGSGDTLLYLYHPNLWKTAQGYLAASAQGRSIFDVMRWKTDSASIALLFPKWVSKEMAKAARGLSHYRRVEGQLMHFNAGYCRIDPVADRVLIERVQADLAALFARFRQVIVLRVPIKEELGAMAGFSPRLRALAENYDTMWSLFRDAAPGHVQAVALPPSAFEFGDFLPYDTHWSAAGNRRFAALARPVLRAAGVVGIISSAAR